MIVFWKGGGAVAMFAMLIATSLSVFYVAEEFFGVTQGPIYQALWGMAFLLCTPAVWFLGRYLNRHVGEIAEDPDMGLDVVIPVQHSLYFLRLEYWSVILGVLGVMAMVSYVASVY